LPESNHRGSLLRRPPNTSTFYKRIRCMQFLINDMCSFMLSLEVLRINLSGVVNTEDIEMKIKGSKWSLTGSLPRRGSSRVPEDCVTRQKNVCE